MPKLSGDGLMLAATNRYWVPLTLTVGDGRLAVPRLLMPEPSEMKLITAVPVLLPALLVIRPTGTKPVLPGEINAVDPLAVAAPVSAPKVPLSHSENPSFAATLEID